MLRLQRSIGLKEAIKSSIQKLPPINRISLYKNNLLHYYINIVRPYLFPVDKNGYYPI